MTKIYGGLNEEAMKRVTKETFDSPIAQKQDWLYHEKINNKGGIADMLFAGALIVVSCAIMYLIVINV